MKYHKRLAKKRLKNRIKRWEKIGKINPHMPATWRLLDCIGTDLELITEEIRELKIRESWDSKDIIQIEMTIDKTAGRNRL